METLHSLPFASSSRKARIAGLIVASLFIFTSPARASMALPDVTTLSPDWYAAAGELARDFASGAPRELTQTHLSLSPSFDSANARRSPAFVQLNAVTNALFAGIGQSPVPVLLPFDTPRFVADRMNGATLAPSHYQGGFSAADYFVTGAAGYGAQFSLPAEETRDLPRRVFGNPIDVQISASRILYDVGESRVPKGEPVRALTQSFPDLRRIIHEGTVRYAFSRFGVAYVVSITCLDSTPRRNRLACREASGVAEKFLRSLKIAGGKPGRDAVVYRTLPEQPVARSADFTYHAPGDIFPGTGYRGTFGGIADRNVYSQFRFPVENVPAYANSQSFLHWGDCNQTGRTPRPSRKAQEYRCRRSPDKLLFFDESHAENYGYPWRDNFCETRDFTAGRCPGGYGHQGQDIRPTSCSLRNEGADRCIPDLFNLVATRDGILIRTKGQQSAFLLVNDGSDHIRFRYLHMKPDAMDADGVLSGRVVREGEKIGLLSNYQDYSGGTSSHLHFDIQAFTREGWVWVSPYMSLVSSYERLIGARGTELGAQAHAPETAPAENVPQSNRPEPSEETSGD